MDTIKTGEIAAMGSLFAAYPDQTLHEVLMRMGAKEFGPIPVVDRNDPTRMLGMIRRHDIVRAYVTQTARSAPSEAQVSS